MCLFFRRIVDSLLLFYAAVIIWFLLMGPVSWQIGELSVTLVDLKNPLIIMALLFGVRVLMSGGLRRESLFGGVLLIFSCLFILAGGEAFLRFYHPESFEPMTYRLHNAALPKWRQRGPHFELVKKEGSARILVQGDSITWGVGVPEWERLYPNRLLEKMRKSGASYDLVTMAEEGREVDWHEWMLAAKGAEFDPDIIIYQWFVNDLEIRKSRPASPKRWWRDHPYHSYLRERSALYRLLDSRFDQLVSPSGGELYRAYLQKTFAEGTSGWQDFYRSFHNWSVLAEGLASQTVLMLYPTVPYSGEYPHRNIHDRLLRMAGDDTYVIPGKLARHTTGGNRVSDKGAPYDAIRYAGPNDPPGALAYGPYIRLSAGKYRATFRLRYTGPIGKVARIDVVGGGEGKTIYAEKRLDDDHFGGANGQWRDITLPFAITGKSAENMEFRVHWFGGGELALESISFPVRRNIITLDLEPILRHEKTHATLFDSHPNAATHEIMAERLTRLLLKKSVDL